ncbi:MAG TPA: fused MFS/spermidine synthase [Tessaracoccus flavescens]|uniref:Fused MFS/spermidine synthase n=1 Tax=Tessaracoccus flavescens TaxID=399497 RepID=A0A921JR24_9ACTN|nr:fused MFS/spermidine synthase [Tessaracoccus flavescens]
MNDRLEPDSQVKGAFWVRFGLTQQSWVDPARPDFLAFEYVQHVAMVLDHTVLDAPAERRLRLVHIGGAGMSIPRWVEWRRPATAQVVCEPDVALTNEVRRKIPLPPRSGIKVRDVDGRAGLAAMSTEWADVIIVDAFDGAQVPGDLVTRECLDDIRRVLREEAVVIFNVTDRAPFDWAKRLAAGLAERWPRLLIGMEPVVAKGKRFGNLLLVASDAAPDVRGIERESRKLPTGYRWLSGREAHAWPGGAEPFNDGEESASPGPKGVGW